jgi:hypothetical protein
MHYKRLKYQTEQVEKLEPHHTCRQIIDDIPNRKRIILAYKTTVVVVVVMIMMIRMPIMEAEEEITYREEKEKEKKHTETQNKK